MKMSSEHFVRLETAIKQVCEERISPEQYTKNNPIFSPKRIRWDYLWAIPQQTRQPLIDEIYAAGLNDDNIDTALRRIVKI